MTYSRILSWHERNLLYESIYRKLQLFMHVNSRRVNCNTENGHAALTDAAESTPTLHLKWNESTTCYVYRLNDYGTDIRVVWAHKDFLFLALKGQEKRIVSGSTVVTLR